MLFRNLYFLTVYFLVGIVGSGCATSPHATWEYRAQTIESDSIQAVVEDPSESKLPLNMGDEIVITTKEKIKISTRNVNWMRMVVDDVNTSRVKGRVEYVSGDVGEGYEDVAGTIVEVQLDNIETIEVWEKKVSKEAASHKPFPVKEMLVGIPVLSVVLFLTASLMLLII